MNTLLFPAILLGAIQGLTEFLPVSSTAHLAVIPRLLGWDNPLLNSLTFDVALHAGTLAALLIILGKDWFRLAPSLLKPRSGPGKFAWGLLLATIPAGLAGLVLEDAAGTALRGTIFVALFLAIGAILLWWADSRFKGKGKAEKTGWNGALLVGCAQALAILPGLSRSGITITAGLAAGLSKKEAARYSFLLSTPLLAAVTAWETRHLPSIASGDLAPMLAGMASAGLTGILALRWLLGLANRTGYRPFAIYRLILAVSLVIWAFLTGTP
jgi:undecaprenyl-diphosphatase